MFPWYKYLLRNYLVCSTSLSFNGECHQSACPPSPGSDSHCRRARVPGQQPSAAQHCPPWEPPLRSAAQPHQAQQTKAQTKINHTIALVPSEPAHSASPPLNSAVLRRPSGGLCLTRSISAAYSAVPHSLPRRSELMSHHHRCSRNGSIHDRLAWNSLAYLCLLLDPIWDPKQPGTQCTERLTQCSPPKHHLSASALCCSFCPEVKIHLLASCSTGIILLTSLGVRMRAACTQLSVGKLHLVFLLPDISHPHPAGQDLAGPIQAGSAGVLWGHEPPPDIGHFPENWDWHWCKAGAHSSASTSRLNTGDFFFRICSLF